MPGPWPALACLSALLTAPSTSAVEPRESGAAPASEDGGSKEVREVSVPTTRTPGRAPEIERPGSQTRVDTELAQEQGAVSLTEALERVPGVRAIEGNAGIGSASTKLNFAVRGVNPRFSSRSTVLLDGVPLAAAPYGQPQLSLFPISLFSVARADVIRGGAPLRYGPQTAGGVLNLISRPIPLQPTVRVMATGDQFGDIGLGAAYGGTHDGLGIHIEYAPRFGRSYRGNSDISVQGGLVKLTHAIGPYARNTTTLHYYIDNVGLPGGLTRTAYDEDPRQSDRPLDLFHGWRLGVANKLELDVGRGDAAEVTLFVNHVGRASEIADGPVGHATVLREQRRGIDVVAFEPVYRKIDGRGSVSNELSLGVRGVLESALIRVNRQSLPDRGPWQMELESDSRLMGWGAYVEDALGLIDDRLVLRAGLRAELVMLDETTIKTRQNDGSWWAPLPAASIWARIADGVAVHAAYRRSFGSPQFLQAAVAPDDAVIRPEQADTVEGGLKVLDQGGVSGEVTAWFQRYRDLVDVGLATYDEVGDTRAWGVDSDLYFNWGSVSPVLQPLLFHAGYGYLRSQIVSGELEGNELPWFPRHSIWGGASYRGRTFRIAAEARHFTREFSDYGNTVAEPADGSVGIIDPYTIVDLSVTAFVPIPGPTRVRFTLGVKNLANEQWFLRTHDRNRGILPMRPRTFYGALAVEHVRAAGTRTRRRKRARKRR